MPQLDDLPRKDLALGIAIGIGAAVLIPAAVVALAPYLKPAARAAVKLGILALERGREAAAAIAEGIEDIAAEVQEELVEARSAARRDAEGDS